MNITFKQQAVNITNCDREPIHIIEQAQQHGVILIIDYKKNKVLQASNNCSTLLNLSVEQIVGKPLENVFPKAISETIFNKIENQQSLYPHELSFKKSKVLGDSSFNRKPRTHY